MSLAARRNERARFRTDRRPLPAPSRQPVRPDRPPAVRPSAPLRRDGSLPRANAPARRRRRCRRSRHPRDSAGPALPGRERPGSRSARFRRTVLGDSSAAAASPGGSAPPPASSRKPVANGRSLPPPSPRAAPPRRGLPGSPAGRGFGVRPGLRRSPVSAVDITGGRCYFPPLPCPPCGAFCLLTFASPRTLPLPTAGRPPQHGPHRRQPGSPADRRGRRQGKGA